MRALLVLATCLATTGGCRSSLRYPSEAELQRTTQSIVREPAFTLFSPYDPAATADYAGVVRDEIGLVRPLFVDQDATPVRVYLAPVEDQAGRELNLWEGPSHEGLNGAAAEGEYAFVYVPARVQPSAAFARASFMHGGTLRHELAHLYAKRAGLSRTTWFNEGLAMEVQCMRTSESGLHAHPFPQYLLAARKFAKPGSLAALIGWSHGDDLSAKETSLRYCWAQALFRFLLEQETGNGFGARARGVMNRTDDEVLAQETAWLTWLGSLDALARIRAGARSASASERAESIGLLPSLAGSGAAELFTRAADELALEMLADPACTEPAATFLLYFRAAALNAEDVEGLNRSEEPALVLTAQALHAKRNEPVDLERARSVWERLNETDRVQLHLLELLVPGLQSGREPGSPKR